MSGTRAWHFCIWGRLGTNNASATIPLSISFMNTAGGGIYLMGTPAPGRASGDGDTSPWPVVMSRTWKKFCLMDAQPAGTITGEFQILLGDKPGVYHFDDPSLEFDNLDTDYMAPANVAARIEAIRKGDFSLSFAGSNGSALAPGVLAGASITMRRHDYPFGGAFDLSQVGRWTVGGWRVMLVSATGRLHKRDLYAGARARPGECGHGCRVHPHEAYRSARFFLTNP